MRPSSWRWLLRQRGSARRVAGGSEVAADLSVGEGMGGVAGWLAVKCCGAATMPLHPGSHASSKVRRRAAWRVVNGSDGSSPPCIDVSVLCQCRTLNWFYKQVRKQNLQLKSPTDTLGIVTGDTMQSSITIHSPADFSEVMQAIESFQEAHQTAWYRGSGKESHNLVPSLFRHPKRKTPEELHKLEKDLASTFAQRSPPFVKQSFGDEWERMFYMQHYGIPTRLLD